MNFEGPKIETVYDKEPKVLEDYLEGKSDIVLQKMIKENYRIQGIIRDDSEKDPESRIFKILPMFSDREIAEKAQEILEKRGGARFFAV